MEKEGNRPNQEIVKPKSDSLDTIQKARGKILNTVLTAGVGVGAFRYLDVYPLTEPSFIDLPELATAVVPLGNLFGSLYNIAETAGHYRNDIKNERVGYIARNIVYRGKKPLNIGEVTLKKGDSFLFVNLPQVQAEDSTPELAQAEIDLQNLLS